MPMTIFRRNPRNAFAAAALYLATAAWTAADTASGGLPGSALQEQENTMTDKPGYLERLEAAYGPPSQAGFGSAVFNRRLEAAVELEQVALATYRYFVGDLWEAYG